MYPRLADNFSICARNGLDMTDDVDGHQNRNSVSVRGGYSSTFLREVTADEPTTTHFAWVEVCVVHCNCSGNSPITTFDLPHLCYSKAHGYEMFGRWYGL